ncbi:MAG TPA: type I-C CRISPR-associated protein Cas7/Csd2 [Anaerohalosphaeraceae bacterium]|nr:type I-C CRISPR-associated protein Cas7/Csd2 [Anaerohalosphaeraceae bacterium]HOL89932.1 type I-C CRISPR-associated protein Cas7/Csd2 [Anaerohalosphaeraceae bacterium]HPP57425.1 type I-C CRISPR-associated protein Cas7/Csd2 [Anaerohalosphaeraceae bacterium]
MSNVLQNRYEFVYLFDVENGNPNGDPDAGNMPRIDPETSYGIVTDVCLKRKVRNYVQMVREDQPPYCIYVKEKAILTNQQKRAYEALKIDKGKTAADEIEKARLWMCRNFFDIRTFGAVMSLKEYNCGQVRGAVQMNFARSIDVICPRELTITRMAVATEKEAESQSGDNRTMGRKNIVPYALYRAEGYISACLAEQTGFTEDDLTLLWEALINMFDHDHSAARGKMCARRLIVFKHESKIGNAPAYKLFDTVQVKPCEGKPPRSYEDYKGNITAPSDGPLSGFPGVTVQNLL